MTTPEGATAKTVRAVFAAIDNGDVQSLGNLVADDLHFRFGNADAIDNKADYLAMSEGFLASLAGIRHEIHSLWELEDLVFADMDVHYERHDGATFDLPCFNVFRVADGLVGNYRIYMDVTPVFSGAEESS